MQTNRIAPLPDTREELTLLHDDIVLKLAIIQLQDDETEQVLRAMDAAEADAAYVRYKEKNGDRVKRLIRRTVHSTYNKHALTKTAPRILQIAATVIAVLSLGLATAIAAVPEIRVKVLTLLIDVHERYTALQLIEKQGSALFVPAEWNGEYFPSYIPEQYAFLKAEEFGSQSIAVFTDKSGNLLEFSEMGESTTIQVDTENAINEYSYIHGSLGFVSTKDNHTSIVWMHHDKYFYLYYTGDKSDAVKIAESVVHIQ